MRSNMTGVGYYNTEPRNFNRGFGRANPKPSQQSQRQPSPPPPRRGGDLFMEAGRLAVEYLVSRGMLSSNVLPGKYQNGSLRNNSGELNDYRGLQERDNSSRRSLGDEDLRSYSRERRRLGSSRSYSFDGTRENYKEGSLTEEPLSSRAMEVYSDGGLKDTSAKDTVTDTVVSAEPATKDDGRGELPVDGSDSKTASLVQNKEHEELVKASDAKEVEETKIVADNNEKEKDNILNSSDIQQGEAKSNPLDSLDTQNFNVISDSVEIPSSKTLASIDEQKSMESLSFMGKTFSYEEKSSGLPELGMLCTSLGKDRGEKRSFEEDKSMEGIKKAKQQWLSVAQSDEFSELSDLSDKHSVSPPKSGVNLFNESDINQPEKQLLSNSFKICDLNLMEASDIHENHEVPLLYPSISGPDRDLRVDIDLSMRNNVANEYNASGSVRKDIEIIDLENASLEGCKSSNTSMKNTEAGMATMENFSNPQNSTENPDAQDGYGFMISELLGNEVSNCSSVQPDINTLHNDMGLNHAEGMFSEDDPIYMSLGEIPLTGLLRAWEQPTQERNPFEL